MRNYGANVFLEASEDDNHRRFSLHLITLSGLSYGTKFYLVDKLSQVYINTSFVM